MMKVNKTEFINALSATLSYSFDQCIIINEILEGHFLYFKKNRDKIVEEFIQKLGIDYEEAMKIYDIAIRIINGEIRNKVRHPLCNRK